jgi:hypothetical protein
VLIYKYYYHFRVHPLVLPTVLQNLVRVLRVQYNSLHESLSCVDNHHSVTALLSSVIHQLYSSPSTIDIDQCGSCRHTVQYLSLDSVFSVSNILSTIDIDQCGSCCHTVQYLSLDSVFSVSNILLNHIVSNLKKQMVLF